MPHTDGTPRSLDALRELDAMGVLARMEELHGGIPVMTCQLLDGTSNVARLFSWPGRAYAVKWDDAEPRDRGLRHEGDVLTALHARGHRCVPGFVDGGTWRDRRWMLTEFVAGGNLFDVWADTDTASGRTRSRASRLGSAVDALRAIASLHADGVRLGDVRPEHVIEHRSDGSGRRVTLLDHASTTVLADWGPAPTEPYRGGCEGYAPREVAHALVHGGPVPLTPEVDVHCFAASLADAVLGRPTHASLAPYLDGRIDEWWKYLASGASPYLPRLERRWPALARVLRAPLSPDPAERPSAAAFADAIEALAEREKHGGDGGTSARPCVPTDRSTP